MGRVGRYRYQGRYADLTAVRLRHWANFWLTREILTIAYYLFIYLLYGLYTR